MTDSKYGMSILYLAVFLLALNGLFSKLIPLDATSITQLRSVLAALTLLLFILISRRDYKLGSFRQYLGVYLIGAILGLHWIAFFHSMQVSTVAIGMLSLFTYPMITVLLEPFYTRQKIQTADIIAALIVLLGLFIMVKNNLQAEDSDIALGVFWGVISAFLFAIRNLLQKYHYQDVSAEKLMLHQVISISFILALFIDYSSVARLQTGDWTTLILLGVISTATAHTLLTYSLKHLPAKSIAMISCLQPLFATLFAWLILAEMPTFTILLGGILIVSVAVYESLMRLTKQPSFTDIKNKPVN